VQLKRARNCRGRPPGSYCPIDPTAPKASHSRPRPPGHFQPHSQPQSQPREPLRAGA
jgi:hypothetical protein